MCDHTFLLVVTLSMHIAHNGVHSRIMGGVSTAALIKFALQYTVMTNSLRIRNCLLNIAYKARQTVDNATELIYSNKSTYSLYILSQDMVVRVDEFCDNMPPIAMHCSGTC